MTKERHETPTNPMGWPEYMTSVCSSVISDKYFITRRYWALSCKARNLSEQPNHATESSYQFENTEPLPPYVISS